MATPPEQEKLKRQNRRVWVGIGVGLVVLVAVAVAVSPDPEPEPVVIAQTDKDAPTTAAPDPATEPAQEPEPTEEPETVEPVEATEEPTETPEPTTEPEPTEEPEPDFDTAAATAELEETLRASIGGQEISDFCDGYADTSWFCFFDHYEVVSPSRIDMHMVFYGGLDTRALAEEGRSWTANMLWKNLPELTTIVSFDSTGLDLGTTFR